MIKLEKILKFKPFSCFKFFTHYIDKIMENKIENPIILIMAGGIGERLWPISRTSSPKQLQKIYSNRTLLQETIKRAVSVTTIENIFIGTNSFLKDKILESGLDFPKENFILEPQGKNTTAIITLASLEFQKRFGNEKIQLVLSADAFINSTEKFKKTIRLALYQAKEDFLVLLGIQPNRPEVDYGYIETGEKINFGFEVQNFYEKPKLSQAQVYIQNEKFYWNPGIFIWKNRVILEELKKHACNILNPIEKAFSINNKESLTEIFEKIPSEPIDKAVMEKTKRVRMIPASFVWDDVGSWISIERMVDGDENENCHIGKQKFYMNSHNNISVCQKPLTAFLGVDNLIIVETEDVFLISDKSAIGDLKKMVQLLKKNKTLQKFTQ